MTLPTRQSDTGRWSPDNTAGANMLKVSESVYNFDGQLIQSRQFASDSVAYVTDYQYDWRGRLTASRSADGLVTVRELDNLGRAYRTKVYADLNGNYFTAGAEASELRGQSERDYDERGQVWRSRVYEVNPAKSFRISR